MPYLHTQQHDPANANVTEILAASIEFAIEDVVQISRHSPTENMPKEEQFRCAMFSFFKQRGYATILLGA